jgi:diadenosine tetraphosphatase ApaH/serine/threonine PP2A family protein phosphatase
MHVLVVSDVHSNIEALTAVFQDAGDFDRVWSLGDIVGYGPNPNECIAFLQDYDHVAIPGNHDWGVLGKLDLSDFNRDAREANLWTRRQLTQSSQEYLQSLPETAVEGDYALAHGSPRHPIWEYLIYTSVAKTNFAHFETQFCLVGHTHVPVLFRDQPDQSRCETIQPREAEPASLDDGRYIVNPGSVGQPRDGDPRAAYALLDTEANTIEHRRVEYDISATQDKMKAADLPFRNIARLEVGW